MRGQILLFAVLMFSTRVEALPDLASGLSKGQCANGPGNEGADSYFVGDFNMKDGKYTGFERWILYANPKWEAKGGKSCELRWRITGSKTSDVGACSDCTEGISFHADVDGSDCPEELVQGRKLDDGRRVGGEGSPFDQKYALKKDPSGRVTVYFAKSGKQLGQGYYDGTGFNYVTDHACKWF